MDFDQMIETWRNQDAEPMYAVNRDALRQTLRSEQARIRRELRFLFRFAYIVGTGMIVFGGFWIALSINNGWPAAYSIAAGVGVGMFALWMGTTIVSRRRQAKQERIFGNTLREEVRRSLSLVDYQLSRRSPQSILMMWLWIIQN